MSLTALDRLMIVERLARYCHSYDAGDLKTWVSGFTEDAVVDLGVALLRGHAEIEQWAVRTRAEQPSTKYARHWNGNYVIDGEGNRAAMSCYYKVVDSLDGGRTIASGVRRDTFENVNGKWLLAQVDVTSDISPEQLARNIERADVIARRADDMKKVP